MVNQATWEELYFHITAKCRQILLTNYPCAGNGINLLTNWDLTSWSLEDYDN